MQDLDRRNALRIMLLGSAAVAAGATLLPQAADAVPLPTGIAAGLDQDDDEAEGLVQLAHWRRRRRRRICWWRRRRRICIWR